MENMEKLKGMVISRRLVRINIWVLLRVDSICGRRIRRRRGMVEVMVAVMVAVMVVGMERSLMRRRSMVVVVISRSDDLCVNFLKYG